MPIRTIKPDSYPKANPLKLANLWWQKNLILMGSEPILMDSERIAIIYNGYGNNSSGNRNFFNGIRTDSKTLLVRKR